MKKDIHPPYVHDANIACACGNIISTGAVKKSMEVEICSACHPFYTGKEKLIDTAGRVDRFKKRAEKATTTTATAKKRQSTTARKVAAKESRTLKAQGEAIKKKLAEKK